MINNNPPQKYFVREPSYLRAGKNCACLFLPAKKRNAWKALNALKIELIKVFNEQLDQEVLNKKFIWWHQELERLINNQARHPLTQAVARDVTGLLDSFDDYEELLSNWDALISIPRYDWMNQNDFVKFCEYSTGGFELLTAQILLGHKPLHQLKEFVLQSNEANTRINLIRDLGEHLRAGRLPIPISQLNSLGLISQEVLQWRDETHANGWEILAAELSSMARESMQKAQQWIAPLPAHEMQTQWITRALNRIELAVLDEIEKSNFKVLSQRIELTPTRSIGIVIKSKLLQ